MKKTKNGYAMIIVIIILLVIVTFGYFYSKNNKNFEPESGNVNTTEKLKSENDSIVSICGRNFKVQTYLIENIDVTKKIIDLINKEYAITEDKEKTNCYWLEQNFNLEIAGNTLKTEVTESDIDYFINITSTKSDSFYLGEGFIMEKNNYDIYNVNAYDGSRGEKIGNLK